MEPILLKLTVDHNEVKDRDAMCKYLKRWGYHDTGKCVVAIDWINSKSSFIAKGFIDGVWFHGSRKQFWTLAYKTLRGTEFEEECLAGMLSGDDK